MNLEHNKIEQLAEYIVENRENKEVVEELLEQLLDYHNRAIKRAYTIGWYESMEQEAKIQAIEKAERIFDKLYGPREM